MVVPLNGFLSSPINAFPSLGEAFSLLGMREIENTAPPQLNARAAIWFLVLFELGQTGGPFVGGLVYGFLTALSGADKENLFKDREHLNEFADQIILPSITLGSLSGALLIFVWARRRWKSQLYLAEGAAWGLGKKRDILRGLGLGLLLSGFYILLSALLIRWIQPGGTPFLVQAASRGSGSESLFWLSAILLLAPFIEEPLFRGLIYAGFTRSFGKVSGGIVTTVIFVLMHIREIQLFWPAGIGISLLAIAAQRFRIRTGAIGPSIATHFAYNSFLLLIIVISLV